ncbi:MAG: universal stress protein [Flavipsychrobacter sp.]
MRKVLLAFDGKNFPKGAFDFIQQLNKNNKISLVGVLLPSMAGLGYVSFETDEGVAYVPAPMEEDESAVQKAINDFEAMCVAKSLDYRRHPKGTTNVLKELQKETRFADLLVIGSDDFYKELGDGSINTYLHDVLRHSECPVLLVPERFSYPDNVIFAYDGSDSAVFSIKQFTYLLPELSKLPCQVVFASKDKKGIPDISYLEELISRHFTKPFFTALQINEKKTFTDWVDKKQHALLVIGSFSRSNLSEMFRKSMATEVIADGQLPIFITHK